MFHRRTLFVLGAGASAEAKMPMGTQLAATIGKEMDIWFDERNNHIGDGDLQLYKQLSGQLRNDAKELIGHARIDADDLQRAGWLIRDGIVLSQSIDDFLDLHRDNPYVNLFGKAAIVKTILEAERTGTLAPDQVEDRP